MHYDSLEFHNVGELRSIPDRGGEHLQRIPESVRSELNEGARERMRHPAGVELRFVPDGTARVTLSSAVRDSTVRVFWGPFQSTEEHVVGADPTTIEVSLPGRLAALKPSVVDELPFDPRVCRLRLPGEHRGGHLFYHGVDGDVRPPRDDELPSTRYLAYGTSITEGEAASAEHLTYVSRTATELGADPLNLGSCGTAFCDAAMADHIAARDDWDVATLALSVNMVDVFPVETFRERAANMVDAIAGENPEKPVACITLYPYHRDLCEGADEDLNRAFREALRDIVAETPHGNVHLIEGPELLPTPGGLTTDLLHPGDDAMIELGGELADRLRPLLAETAAEQ